MLDWIMTIPGLLITSGVVLLILAIILFIIGNKKGKAAKVVENTNDVPAPEAISTDTISTVTEPVVEEPIANETETVSEATPANGVINFTPEVETPVEEAAPVVESEPVNEVSVEAPVVEEAPAVEIPAAQESAPVEEVTQPAEEPEFDFSISETPAEETPVTIYGGNDPLENTQAVNVVEEHVPYGGAPEVNVVETPAVEETPVVAQPTIEIPEVQPEPVVAEPTVETPTQPAIEIPEPTITTDNTNM